MCLIEGDIENIVHMLVQVEKSFESSWWRSSSTTNTRLSVTNRLEFQRLTIFLLSGRICGAVWKSILKLYISAADLGHRKPKSLVYPLYFHSELFVPPLLKFY